MTIAIYGPGGFGRELIMSNSARQQHDRLFISDDLTEIGSIVEGVPVYSLDQVARIEAEAAEDYARSVSGGLSAPTEERRALTVVIAVAGFQVRRVLADKVAASGLLFGQIRAPTVVVGAGVSIGEGAILCDFSMITASATIGRHFHANIYSYVAHDCTVGDFVTLAPRACVNGNTIIEDDVYIGTGAILKQGTPDKPLRIGRGAVIGMGAVVTKDVPAGAVMVGNPARPRE